MLRLPYKQGPVKVGVCTICLSMHAAGMCAPTWINAAMWRWLVTRGLGRMGRITTSTEPWPYKTLKRSGTVVRLPRCSITRQAELESS
jgi:hypothetical protein